MKWKISLSLEFNIGQAKFDIQEIVTLMLVAI